MKRVSSGTVILKGEAAENKSAQQPWPTFTLLELSTPTEHIFIRH